MNEENKSFYLSKTLIVNLIIAGVAFWPPAKEWVSNNPEATLLVVSAIGALLRIVTSGRIVLS